jgi:hypothetical protein
MSWRMWWQDWTGHMLGTPAPKRQHEDYPTDSEARAAANSLRKRLGGDLVISVMRTPPPRALPKRRNAAQVKHDRESRKLT